MSLKQKFNETKEKCKPYIPAILGGLAVGASVVFALVNQDLQKNNARMREVNDSLEKSNQDLERFMDYHFDRTQVHLTDEVLEKFESGEIDHIHLTNPDENFDFILMKDNRTED
jgi:hypothetical protein